LFAAWHPRLPAATQVALALRVATDLELPLVAAALLTSEAALAQRLVRAREALVGDALALPAGHELPPRREAVMTVLALMFRCSLHGQVGGRDVRPLSSEASRQARAPAAHRAVAHADALAATLLLHGARLSGRWDKTGEIVPLAGQPRDRWDAGMLRMGLAHLQSAQRGERLSRWHLLAGIAAEHATAPDHDRTNWAAILRYYELLLTMDSTVAPKLALAIALAEAGAPAEARASLPLLLPQVPAALKPHTLAALARASERTGDVMQAGAWLQQAVAAVPAGADARLLARRLEGLMGRD
jgi:RNA polymerase sigma-70 factor (ECF subfamily)